MTSASLFVGGRLTFRPISSSNFLGASFAYLAFFAAAAAGDLDRRNHVHSPLLANSICQSAEQHSGRDGGREGGRGRRNSSCLFASIVLRDIIRHPKKAKRIKFPRAICVTSADKNTIKSTCTTLKVVQNKVFVCE